MNIEKTPQRQYEAVHTEGSEEAHPPVKAAYYEAWVDGNILLPQTNF